MKALKLLALLLLAAPAFAAQLSELRAVPQVQLGAVPLDLAPLAVRLRASLPTIQALDLAVPAAAGPEGARAVPAAFAADKAQALLGRLAAGVAINPNRPLTAAEPEDAKKTISAINAVLKDFTPEQIERLPEEKLAAVSAVLFDHMGERAASRDELEAGAAALSEASEARMLSQRGLPMREKIHNQGHTDMHPDIVTVHGVPAAAKPVDNSGVFRHYTTKEGYEAIVKTGLLQNGYVPYVQLAPGVYKKTFKDVGGLFLTKPGVDGGSVGVPDRDYPYYVDVVLPAAMKLLELEAGSIWLVPLPARTRAWIAKSYRQWAETGTVDPQYAATISGMDEAGGPGPDVSVPVRIVAHGGAR